MGTTQGLPLLARGNNAGKNRQGWFTNRDLIRQFEAQVEVLEFYHQDKELLFMFDNSMTHHKKKPGALDVTQMNKSDGGNQPTMKLITHYRDSEGQLQVQLLQHPCKCNRRECVAFRQPVNPVIPDHIPKEHDGVQKGVLTTDSWTATGLGSQRAPWQTSP